MREIAALKKTLPARAAREYSEVFWEGVRGDEEGLARAVEEVKGGEATVLLPEGAGRLERGADVERGYAGVVGVLGRLRREMPAVVARMERARVAGEYVVTER